MKDLTVSIIIRFKNEIKYLTTVYESIKSQNIESNIEIISVNNNSSDGSFEIAKKYSDKLLNINVYEPGKALNLAISQTLGTIIVILSAHTIPGNKHWLTNLIKPLIDKNADKKIIATYGAQIYPYYSEFLDKRDLDIFNFANSRKETMNTDFWNANSAFKKKIWEKYKFCEKVYEVEDHFWTKNILSNQNGYVYFNPDAYVYHYEHIDRIDRKYPYINNYSKDYLLKTIKKILTETDEWSAIMWAGLMCNSIPYNFIKLDIVELLGTQLINHWDFDVRWRIAQTLGNIPGDASIRYLSKALYDKSFYPQNEAAWSLKKHLPYSIQEVKKVFLSSDGDTKLYASFVLANSQLEKLQLKVIKYLNKQLYETNELLLNSLYIIGEIAHLKKIDTLIPTIFKILYSTNISDRILSIAIWCLGRLYENHNFNFPVDFLISKLNSDKNSHIVCYESVNAICRYILKSNKNNIIQMLYNLYKSQDGRVQHAICLALRVISKKNNVNLYKDSLINETIDFGAIFEIKNLKRRG